MLYSISTRLHLTYHVNIYVMTTSRKISSFSVIPFLFCNLLLLCHVNIKVPDFRLATHFRIRLLSGLLLPTPYPDQPQLVLPPPVSRRAPSQDRLRPPWRACGCSPRVPWERSCSPPPTPWWANPCAGPSPGGPALLLPAPHHVTLRYTLTPAPILLLTSCLYLFSLQGHFLVCNPLHPRCLS